MQFLLGRRSPQLTLDSELKSLIQAVFKIYLIVCQKISGSRDLSHAPFGECYLCLWLAFRMRSYGPNLKSVAQIALKIS